MPTKLPFLPDEHHYAIAAVALRASQLDWHIEQLISATLRKQPGTAEFLLKNLAGDRIVRAAKAILLDTIPEQSAQILALFSEIKRLRKDRNEILHSIWGKSPEEGKAVHLDARPFREHSQGTKTAAEIQKIADDLTEVIRAMIQWENLIHSRSLLPSRGTPAPPIPQPN